MVKEPEMRILITYFTQSNNTAKVARSIYDEILTQDHQVDLEKIENITPGVLDEYNLVFIGSACHDADVAQPVKEFLERISPSPAFKMAGFVTHATFTGEGGAREKELYEKWAGKCIKTFAQVSEDKNIELLGYFHCQGVPIPPIADFIHQVIVTDKQEWKNYEREVKKHPDENDLLKAKEFANEVLLKYA
jgi:flavodoxin